MKTVSQGQASGLDLALEFEVHECRAPLVQAKSIFAQRRRSSVHRVSSDWPFLWDNHEMADYTHEVIGKKIGKGEIQICPHCQKPALVEVTNGMRFFTHSATSITRANGGARVEYVECPPEKISSTK